MSTTPSASSEEASVKYVCGIDIGSQSCSGCVTRPDKSVKVKPLTFANTKEGWKVMEEKLTQLDAAPNQIVIGMEAHNPGSDPLRAMLMRYGSAQ